jgi:hypothetical protein
VAVFGIGVWVGATISVGCAQAARPISIPNNRIIAASFLGSSWDFMMFLLGLEGKKSKMQMA